jgi:surface protein
MIRDIYIKGYAAPAPTEGWVRPADWLTMPTVVDTDDTFVALHAVFPSGNNFVAFRFTTNTGDYEVDWGDGTVTTYASNVTAEHEYNYSTYDPTDSTLSTRGYKQAIITVTPLTGELRTANFQLRYVTTPAQNQAYATGLLDCILSMPNVSNVNSPQIIFGGTTVMHRYVERFRLLNIGNAVRLDNIFFLCVNLQKVEMPTNTSSLNNLSGVFSGCTNLQEIPLFDTSNVTAINSCFSYTRNLKYLPNFDFTKVTNLTDAFNGSGIIEVNLDLPEATTFNQCFLSCSRLIKAELLNTSKNTTFRFCFWNCYSLKEVVINSVSTISAVSLDNIFFGCFSLQEAPFFDTSTVNNMSGMFNGCRALNSIPAYNTTNVTNMVSFATNCNSLDLTNIVCPVSVNFQSCQLSQAELVNIFNNLLDRTLLPAANINITGNWGASALTAPERAIATAKNWTITG